MTIIQNFASIPALRIISLQIKFENSNILLRELQNNYCIIWHKIIFGIWSGSVLQLCCGFYGLKTTTVLPLMVLFYFVKVHNVSRVLEYSRHFWCSSLSNVPDWMISNAKVCWACLCLISGTLLYFALWPH